MQSLKKLKLIRNLRSIWAATGMVAALAMGPTLAQDKPRLAVKDDSRVTVRVPAVAGISYLAADVALTLAIKPFATTYMTAGRAPDFLLGLTKDMAQLGQRAKPNLELLSNAKPDPTYPLPMATTWRCPV